MVFCQAMLCAHLPVFPEPVNAFGRPQAEPGHEGCFEKRQRFRPQKRTNLKYPSAPREHRALSGQGVSRPTGRTWLRPDGSRPASLAASFVQAVFLERLVEVAPGEARQPGRLADAGSGLKQRLETGFFRGVLEFPEGLVGRRGDAVGQGRGRASWHWPSRLLVTATAAKLLKAVHKARDAGKPIGKALYDKAKEFYEEAFYRSLFIGAENSMGFHNPTEAMRVLGDSVAVAKAHEPAAVEPSVLVGGWLC